MYIKKYLAKVQQDARNTCPRILKNFADYLFWLTAWRSQRFVSKAFTTSGSSLAREEKAKIFRKETMRHGRKSADLRYNGKWLQYLFGCEKHSPHPYLGESGSEWLGVSRSGTLELVFEFFLSRLFLRKWVGVGCTEWRIWKSLYDKKLKKRRSEWVGVGRRVFY